MKTVGVIGLGSIGMRHAKNLLKMGYQVMSYDPAIKGSCADAEELIARADAEELIARSDAVVIASPTHDHGGQLQQVIAWNKPVFVEKPIGHEIRTGMEAVTMVGYNLRWHSCVKKAKEWLDNGRIGRPLWAQFTLGQFSEKPPYLRDGVILNWSHELDLALYLLGPAQLAASSTRKTHAWVDYDNPDAALKDDISDILITHSNGCMSSVHLDYVTEPEIRQFIIGGEFGTIQAYLVDRYAELKAGPLSEDFQGVDTWNDNYIEEMQAFLDRCDGKETIGCSGEEGLRVLELCLEVRRRAGLE